MMHSTPQNKFLLLFFCYTKFHEEEGKKSIGKILLDFFGGAFKMWLDFIVNCNYIL